MVGILEQLTQGWLGLLLGVLGLGFGIYQLVRRNTGRLVFQGQGVRLLGGSGTLPRDVRVIYKDRDVPRLSSRRMVIWNAGRAPLRGSDISAGDPLRIEFDEDAEILDHEVVKTTRAANGFSLEISPDHPNVRLIRYEFLDQGDGAVVDILHTGERTYGEVRGTLVGQPEGPVNLRSATPLSSGWRSQSRGSSAADYLARTIVATAFGKVGRVMYGSVGLGGLAVLTYALFPKAVADLLSPIVTLSPAPEGRASVGVLGALYGFTGIPLLWLQRRRFPRALVIQDQPSPDASRHSS